MTIIQPNKNKFKLNFAVILAGGFILLEAMLSVFANNFSVELAYALKTERKNLEVLRAETAELKNDLYAILDIQDAEEFSSKFGLVKDKKPNYLANRD